MTFFDQVHAVGPALALYAGAGAVLSADLLRGRRASISDLVLRPPFQFLKMYVLRLGFLDGMHGLTLCLLSASYVFVKYAKLAERSMAPPR